MIKRNREEVTRRIAQILRDRHSALADDVAKVQDVRELPHNIRKQIVSELGEEFSAKGLQSDGEPNAYGLEMEDLTDACGLPWAKEGLH